MTDELLDIDEQDSDYDGAWKEAIRDFFRAFIEVYFPSTSEQIDWRFEPEWLDKELSQIIAQAGERNRVVDVLAKVRLLNGEEQWILLHVEIQTGYEVKHAERLASYNAGIMWTFKRPVVTLAILADLRPNWLPRDYEFQCADFKVRWDFSVCKLLHRLESDWQNDNRLPVVLARAQIAALRTASDPEGRFDAKWQLIRYLYDAGFSAQEIRPWFRLIDWMMHLRADLERQLKTMVSTYEEALTVPYVTSWERMGRIDGRKEGRNEGLATAAGIILSRRCGSVPDGLQERLAKQPTELLTALLQVAPDFGVWNELEEWLEQRTDLVTDLEHSEAQTSSTV